MKREIGNPSFIRDMNRQMVFSMIEEQGPISRAGIARKSGLSFPTVSQAVEYLLKQGLVLEVGQGKSMGGRRPTLLLPNRSLGYVLGIDLGGSNLEVQLADLGGNVICKATGQRVNAHTGTNINTSVRQLYDQMLAKAGIDPSKVLGAGVAAPGVTDQDQGIVSLAPTLGWESFPLKRVLEQELGIPIVIENDVNAAAFGERLYGAGVDYNHFVFVFVGSGIGAGIIIDGELYSGHEYLAGDIGFLVLDPDWKQDKHSGFGCLEKYASVPAILSSFAQHNPGYFENDALSDEEQLRMIFNEMSRNCTKSNRVVERAAKYLAMALANLLWVLSPNAIILGGTLIREGGDILISLIKEELKVMSPRVPEMCVSQLEENAGIIGVISMAVRKVKQDILMNSLEIEG